MTRYTRLLVDVAIDFVRACVAGRFVSGNAADGQDTGAARFDVDGTVRLTRLRRDSGLGLVKGAALVTFCESTLGSSCSSGAVVRVSGADDMSAAGDGSLLAGTGRSDVLSGMKEQ